MAVTLSEIRTQVRQRANQENSQFVTDAELNGYINASAYELYDLLVEKYASAYYYKNYVFSLTSGTNEYDLPADLYKLFGAEMILSGDYRVTMQRFNWGDRNKFNLTGLVNSSGTSPLYSIVGKKMRLMPNPQSSYQISIDYVPFMIKMVADSDTMESFNGWEEYVVVDAAIKCMTKEESDPSILMAEKQGLINRIENAASNRDTGNPPTITNVNNQNGNGWPFGNY